MSWSVAVDPGIATAAPSGPVELIIVPRLSDIGGFAVRRALPSRRRQMVGPFIFLDQMGPAEFVVGEGLDVRPHPHIGLATVTYLFAGEIVHLDSLGSRQAIRPGDLNWMTAGRGITHSERSPAAARGAGGTLAGLQIWVALPAAAEETGPGFVHHPAASLPPIEADGVSAHVLVGSLWGATSPVTTFSDTLYADVAMRRGAILPLDPVAEERAVYLVEGRVEIAGDEHESARLLIFRPGDRITIRAMEQSRLVVLGGAAIDGPRYIWWNFVASRKDRIEQAKADWMAGRFAPVPGEADALPLPGAGG